MVLDINLLPLLAAAFIAMVSPGPATLALAGTSMAFGRRAGLALASGITTGSLAWSMTAALGLGALMATHVWMLEILRYLGVAYLMYLAIKAARSALLGKAVATKSFTGDWRVLYLKGLALHLTNPKAILFFGSLYSIGLPPETSSANLALVVAAVGLQSAILFHCYAFLFSSKAVTRVYLKMHRGIEGVLALAFTAASLKILTARLV